MSVDLSARSIYVSSGGYDGLGAAPRTDRWAMIAKSLTSIDTELASHASSIATLEDTATGAGTVGTTTGLSVTESYYTGKVRQTKIMLSDVSVTINDGTNAEYGSVKLYDFPAGAIQIMGGLVDVMVEVEGESLSATADGDVHVGTTAQTDVAAGSLVSTEDDIVSTNALATLADGVGVLEAQDGVATALLDGTGTAKDAYLNILFDAGACGDGDDAVTLTGQVYIYWMNVGDYLMSGELPA